MKTQDYWRSIEDFCDLCEETIPGQFVSFIVIGSVGADDFVPGWSDVDAFLIVKETSSDIRPKVDSMIKVIAKKYPYYQTDRGPWFCAMITTKGYFVDPIESTNPLNLWDVKHYGKFIRGDNFIGEIKLPKIDKSWSDTNTRWMKDFLERDRDASAFWQLRNSVGFILCGARNVLLKNGIYFKRYDDILSKFSEIHPEKASLVAEAHGYRKNWSRWQNEPIDVGRFYKDALAFLEWALTTK